MAIETLDPSLGSFVLDSATGPTSATYSPSTQADYSGDGDVDDYALYDDISATFGGAGFLDSNASANQEILLDVKPVTSNSNARLYQGAVVDAVTYGAKNANAGYYIENRPGKLKLGTLSTGNKSQAPSGLTDGTWYYWRITYDPNADTVSLDVYTSAADRTNQTNVWWASGGVDCSGGDSTAGGQPYFQVIDTAARGKGTALYEYIVANVDYGQGGGTLYTQAAPIVAAGVTGLSTMQSYFRSMPIVATGVAVNSIAATFAKTLASVATALPGLSRVLSYFRSHNMVASGVPLVSWVRGYARTFAVQASGVASLVTAKFFSKTVTVIATGVTGLGKFAQMYIARAITATGVIGFSRVATRFRTMAMTALGMATGVKKMFVTSSVVAVCAAASSYAQLILKSFAVTTTGIVTSSWMMVSSFAANIVATGLIGFSRVSTRVRAFAVQATGLVGRSTTTTFRRVLAVVASGVTSISKTTKVVRSVVATGVTGLSAGLLTQVQRAITAVGTAFADTVFIVASSVSTVCTHTAAICRLLLRRRRRR
ncbi:MAG: hypothetical protein ACE5FH_12325 [Candidatus Zixiibacteriota bacterium]